jgi:hypothetical protein
LILGALALLGFGAGDLVALLPLKNAFGRVLAAGAAIVVVLGVAALSGMRAGSVAVTTIIAVPAVIWIVLAPEAPAKKHVWLLLLPITALLGTTAASGSAAEVDGDLARWYEQLPLDFASSEAVSADQFLLGVGAFLFMMATSNQIVKLVLAMTDLKDQKEDELPRGGRLLGPMERLIVAAAVLAGAPAGAGFVIAAKGLLRFPEVSRPGKHNVHQLTEYLLVGTFTSVLIAGILSVLVLVSS